MRFDHGPEEVLGGAVSDAELTDSRVRADGTKLVGLMRVERQLRGGLFGYLKDAIGSAPANQSPELVARNLPVELGFHTADVRLDRVPTQS